MRAGQVEALGKSCYAGGLVLGRGAPELGYHGIQQIEDSRGLGLDVPGLGQQGAAVLPGRQHLAHLGAAWAAPVTREGDQRGHDFLLRGVSSGPGASLWPPG